jgi:hypothetical protein
MVEKERQKSARIALFIIVPPGVSDITVLHDKPNRSWKTVCEIWSNEQLILPSQEKE